MYRACSTWQYEVIAHLLEKHREGMRLGYLTAEKFAGFDVAWADRPSWSVLKSHEGDRCFTSAIAEGRMIAVYAYRDIRDVVFSLMHKRSVSFGTLVRQGMIHQILVNDRFWTAQPGVLCQRYEDLIADPVTGVEQLAAHLGLTLAPGEAAEVAGEYSFQANRQRTLNMGHRLRAEGVNLDDPSNVQYYDLRTLLHWNHMRDGRAGNWRALATASQRAFLSRLCDRWLAEHGYETDARVVMAAEGHGAVMPGIRERVLTELGLARSWIACSLRCASLRYPKVARGVKRCLGMKTNRIPARPIDSPSASNIRFDRRTLNEATARAHEPSSSPQQKVPESLASSLEQN
jgi:hypothetical protein